MGMTGMVAMMALSAASAAVNTLSSGAQQRQQAAIAQAQSKAQAAQYDAQAKNVDAQNRVRQEELDRQKVLMRRQYAEEQARNRVLLAGGNVDSATGSAVDVAMGNANRFAADVGQNRYIAAMEAWNADSQRKSLEASAQNHRNMADYYGNIRSNVGSTLLMAGLNGLVAAGSTYVAGGGMWGGGGSQIASHAGPTEWTFFNPDTGAKTATYYGKLPSRFPR